MNADAPITPPPLPMIGDRVDPAVDTVILFGGSFDPPHKAHIHLPLVVRQQIERTLEGEAWLLLVPAARSPHKQGPPRATDAQRLEMLNLAAGHLPRTGVWTDELDRPSPSFTIDTVQRLRRWLDEHSGENVTIRLLIGADQAAEFHRWREPRAILALARPLVLLREKASDQSSLLQQLEAAAFWTADELNQWGAGVVPVGLLPVSSTDVRDAFGSAGEETLKRSLDTRVLAYIRAHGLYGAQ